MNPLNVLIASLSKDLKLIVRNWHTLIGFMILPFLLIMVIGYLFGSDDIGPVIVGFEGIDPTSLPLGERITPVQVDSCVERFAEERLVACLIQDDTSVQILVDNSRTNLFSYTVSLLQQGIERQNERLATASIGEFKNELTLQLDALQETESQIILVTRSIEAANRSIDDMQVSFDATSRSLMEERIVLQETRAQLERLNQEFNARSTLIAAELNGLSADLRDLDSQLRAVRSQADALYRTQIDDMLEQIDRSLRLIANLQTTLGTVGESQDVVLTQVVSSSERLDDLIANLSVYENQIENQRSLIGAFAGTADDLRVQLVNVENGTRTALEFSPRDILRSFNARFALFYDDDVRIIILPMVIMMILVLLSIVIASLLTHEEVMSPAMIRVELSASPRWIIDLSKLIMITIIVLINVMLMYAIAVLLWNASFAARIPLLILISIPVIITFAHLGMALAYLIRKPFLLFVSATFTGIFFITSSGILRPAELLDPARSFVITANPSAIFMNAASQTIFSGTITGWTGILIWLVISLLILIAARSSWFKTVFRD